MLQRNIPKKSGILSILTTFALVAGGAVLSATPASAAPLTDCGSAAASCAWDYTVKTEVQPAAGKKVWLKFTAPYNGRYVFESTDMQGGDPYGEIWDSKVKLVAYNNNSGTGYNFKITATLVAGQDYYLAASHYGTRNTGTYWITGTVIDGVSVTPTSWAPNYEAQSLDFTVATNGNAWKVASNAAWLTVGAKTGTAGATLTATVTENKAAARTGKLTFTVGTATQIVTVTQSGAALTVTPDYWLADYQAQSRAFTVTSSAGTNWTAASSASWLKVSPTSGKSGAGFNASVTANTGAERTATITVKAGTAKVIVTVVQASKGKECFSWEECQWGGAFPNWPVNDLAKNTRYFLWFNTDVGGLYKFYSTNEGLDVGDLHAEVFNANKERIAADGGPDGFYIEVDLEANAKYYIVVWRTEKDPGKVKLDCKEKKALAELEKCIKKGKCEPPPPPTNDNYFEIAATLPITIVDVSQIVWYPGDDAQLLRVSITTNVGAWTAQIIVGGDWYSIDPTSGANTGVITVSVSENPNPGQPRYGYFTIASGDVEKDFLVTQSERTLPNCTTARTACEWGNPAAIAMVYASPQTGTDQWFRFVPPDSQGYLFVSSAADFDSYIDPYGELYDSAGNLVSTTERFLDQYGDPFFELSAPGLVAGQSYYLRLFHVDRLNADGNFWVEWWDLP